MSPSTLLMMPRRCLKPLTVLPSAKAGRHVACDLTLPVLVLSVTAVVVVAASVDEAAVASAAEEVVDAVVAVAVVAIVVVVAVAEVAVAAAVALASPVPRSPSTKEILCVSLYIHWVGVEWASLSRLHWGLLWALNIRFHAKRQKIRGSSGLNLRACGLGSCLQGLVLMTYLLSFLMWQKSDDICRLGCVQTSGLNQWASEGF